MAAALRRGKKLSNSDIMSFATLRVVPRITLAFLTVLVAIPVRGQDSAIPSHQHAAEPPASAWAWRTDASVFFGYNYQQRKFTDFSAWESQNWFMLAGKRALGPGTMSVDGMISLEPFTLKAIGSPQVFQTGETYKTGPLIDYQHPHDLIMNLGAAYRIERHGVAYLLGAAVVGSPALGPTPFMHRESGRDNPQVPLVHHYTDSTHITPGVLTAGVDAAGVTIEGSWFRGAEPNENRLNIDRPRLDSWSARASWRRGPWRAQFSGGHLHRPEVYERFDMSRLTASIEFAGAVGSRPLAASLVWGENREIHGILDGYLLEWTLGTTAHGRFYGRAEAAAKNLLDLGGIDPPGFFHFHRISHVAALTLGYVQDLAERRWGRLGVGGDVTVYHVPQNMLEYYGAPHSFHVFVRYRPNRSASAAHVHP
jgi:hypothetical protein